MIDSKVKKRFYSKIDTTPGQGPWGNCHLWTGASNSSPGGGRYGVFWYQGKNVSAHVFSFFIENNFFPVNQCCHKCDIPLCCNPDHLYDGSQSDNNLDCLQRRRNTCCKLTEEEVRYIRNKAKLGWFCKADLAKELGVHRSTVSRVVSGIGWRHIT